MVIESPADIHGRSPVKLYSIFRSSTKYHSHEVATIITRAGEQTNVVFTGDIHQINHPALNSQSLFFLAGLQDETRQGGQ